ncbi:hypothetical protein [Hymenobacter sp. B81]|uniref:hypothetical protein n=1 Tax=Hymenobacter sp. B81 TaxID=3344878 RepID=UPI0037DD6791
MRYPLLCLAALAVTSACQTGQPDTERNPAVVQETITSPEAQPSVLPARRLRALLRSEWVKAAYLDALQQTHSPQMVGETKLAYGNMAFSPSPETQRADSVFLDVNWNNHEGSTLKLVLQPRVGTTAFPLLQDSQDEDEQMELTYAMPAGDTLLQINTYNRRRKLRESVLYRRVKGGIAAAVNQALVAGAYTGVDSLGRPVRVRLGPDGLVTGLPGLKTYQVNIDFNGGPETGEDMLFCNIDNDKQRKDLGYRIAQDTLRLYSLRTDSIAAPYLHRVLYTLVRRRS